MELICGACHGRLLAELPGTTVACPHCGTHLQTPAVESATLAEASIMIDAGDSELEDVPDPDTDTVRIDPWVPPIANEPAVAAEAFGAALSRTDLPAGDSLAPGPRGQEEPTASAPGDTAGDVVFSESSDAAGDAPHNSEKTTVVGFVVVPTAQGEISAVLPTPELEHGDLVSEGLTPLGPPEHSGDSGVTPAENLTDVAGAAGSSRGVKRPISINAGIGVPKMAFVALLSYASAVTLGCLYLSYLLWHNPRTLDLPDLAPPVSKDKRKVTSLIYLPPDKEIPSANVLKLGESRRFGSVMVTPVRVTRGPVEFVYDDPTGGDSNEKRDPEGPVLKLHLRFENVSKDQEFVPLDRRLVYTKELDRKAYGVFKTNNFVCNLAERINPASHVLVFDQSPDSSWLMKDQNLDRELNPGEVLDTYIATTPEQIESLEGDLVWRVHFRKGYNPKSLRGVTTLIEVLFRSSDIVDDEPPASPEADDRKAVEPDQQPAEENDQQEPEPGTRKPAVKDA